MYEKTASEVETYKTQADKWTSYEATRREALLKSVPEEERETISKLDLDTLEYVTNKISSVKANPPQVMGNARQEVPSEPVDWTNKDNLRKNWKNILAEATKKN